VTDVPRLAQDLKHQIREFERIALEHAQSADPAGAIGAALRGLWRELARAMAATSRTQNFTTCSTKM